MRNTEAIVKKVNSLAGFLLKHKQDFEMVLPKHISLDKFMRLALTSIRRNPKIAECSPQSVAGVFLTAASLGLEIDVRGLAYPVPYWNSKTQTRDLQLIIGYKGLVDLARRSGQISVIYAKEVYKGDQFKIEYGTNPKIEHIPTTPDKRGEMIGCYAVAVMKDGGWQFEFMWKEDIDEVRAMAKTDEIWSKHYVDMARKTVVRRLAKMLPLSPEAQKAVAIDELGEVHDVTADVLYTEMLPENVIEDAEVIEESEKENTKAKEVVGKVKKKSLINNDKKEEVNGKKA